MARDGISDFVFRLPGYREGSWLYHRVEKCIGSVAHDLVQK